MPDRGQLALHLAAGDGRVGARTLGDDEEHALLALDAGRIARFFDRVTDQGHVPEVDRPARGGDADDDRADVLQVPEFAQSPHQEIAVALDDVARRLVDVFHPEGHEDRVQGQFLRLQGGLVHVHQDLAHVRGVDRRGGHAVETFEPGRHFVLDELLELEKGPLGRDAVKDDGHLPQVELHNQGVRGFRGQDLLIEPDLVADILGGEVQIRAPFKFDADGRHALQAQRPDLLHSVDGAHDLLQGLGQSVLHVLGGGAGIGGDDGYCGILDIGEEIEAQLGERQRADDDQDHGHHRGRDATLDREFREFHSFTSPVTSRSMPSSRP